MPYSESASLHTHTKHTAAECCARARMSSLGARSGSTLKWYVSANLFTLDLSQLLNRYRQAQSLKRTDRGSRFIKKTAWQRILPARLVRAVRKSRMGPYSPNLLLHTTISKTLTCIACLMKPSQEALEAGLCRNEGELQIQSVKSYNKSTWYAQRRLLTGAKHMFRGVQQLDTQV